MDSNGIILFTAELQKHPKMNASFVEFPFDTVELFGKKGMIKVHVIFDSLVEYRGSLANMGGDKHCLGVTQEIRKKLNKTFGDAVEIQLKLDTVVRTVEIPDDIQEILDANPEAKILLQKMSYTQRKEYINWICEARKPATRKNASIR